MFKLENGKLISPPKVWKGRIGYDKNLDKLVVDGWKPLIETGEGELFNYVNHKDYIEKIHFKPVFDYRAEREKAYPPIGDVVDALLKAYQGDDKELQVIITQREIVKKNIKKPV